MKNKIISISIIFIFLFTTLISVDAAAPSPRIDLNEYEIETADKNNIYISGIVSIGAGQNIALFDSAGKIPLNYTTVKDTGSQSSFKIWVPATFLKDGINTFKVISLPVRGRLNASNPKTVTITIKNKINKKDQTITANNIELYLNESKNINATVNSKLPLTYLSKDSSIATVDAKGNVYGKKVGTTSIDIIQAGNSQFNPAKKTITVTVKQKQIVKKNQTISTNFDTWQFYDTGSDYKITLKAKASSKLKVTWKSSNSKIASINSKGVIIPKKPGTVKITITQKGNANYKPITKSVILRIPKKRSRKAALKPWYNAMRTQAKKQNANGAIYSWSGWEDRGRTQAASEHYGTCITFPSASLMRIGLLSSGEYLTPQDGDGWNSHHKNAAIRYMSYHPGYFSYANHYGSLRSGVDSGKILPGDIIHYSYHTLVFEEKKNGVYYISDAGHNGTANRNYAIIHHATSGNEYVGWINRINCYDVKTTCKNGTMTKTNTYMAGSTVKVTYKPNKGKKLQAIRVDGKLLSKSQMKKYKNGYTINRLNKNHYINVVFN